MSYNAPGRPLCEALAQELGGPEEATVFGSGLRTSARNASLVNGYLICYLGFNDVSVGGHNSAAIASILAVSEREKARGRDFLTSLVISYELGARFAEGIIGPSLEERGWDYDMRAGLSMPPTLGRLMGLNEDQIANAIGICASRSLPLGILDCHREEITMIKGLTFEFVAHDAFLSCLLAKKGFTGPIRVIEGDAGIRQSILHGDMDLERMTDFSGWRTLRTWHKTLGPSSTLFWHASATLALVNEHDLKPKDVESVRVKADTRVFQHTTTLTRKYPRNPESAHHSAFYPNAVSIKERSCGPEQFTPEKLDDPVILDLINRITVECDPSLPKYVGIVEIKMKDGRRFEKNTGLPHGVVGDPFTDREVEEKFKIMAGKHMDDGQIRKIIDTVWNTEKLGDMGQLTALMVFNRSHSPLKPRQTKRRNRA
jgi:2-methylcitrate dehydratase